MSNSDSHINSSSQIDLFDWFFTSLKYWKFLTLIVALFFFITTILLFFIPSVFDASATIKIGTYKNIDNLYRQESVLLEESQDIKFHYESLFNGDNLPAIKIVDSDKNFIYVSTQANSSSLAKQNISTFINQLLDAHSNLLNVYISDRNEKLSLLESQIDRINNLVSSDLNLPNKSLLLVTLSNLENEYQLTKKTLSDVNLSNTKLIGSISASSTPSSPRKLYYYFGALIISLLVFIFYVSYKNLYNSHL